MCIGNHVAAGSSTEECYMCNVSCNVWQLCQQLIHSGTEIYVQQVLIIHGKQDRLVPASNSRRLVNMLPNAELVELDVCGHMPQEEVPDQFVDVMQRFLQI